MRHDLRRPGESGAAETTAFAKEGSSGQDGWAAVSSMMQSARKAGAGGVTHEGVIDRCWAEAEIASGMSGSEGGGEVWLSGSSSSSESCPRHCQGAYKGSAKSEGTLKHSVSLGR